MKGIRAVIVSAIALGVACGALAAQDNELSAKSTIKGVVVYADRAHVERSAPVEVKPGRTSILFENLPDGIDASSLQVDGNGPVVLEDIVFRTKHFAEIPDERIKALQAEREILQAKLVSTSDKISRASSEKSFLEKIVGKVTATQEEGQSELNPDKWVQMMKFYRERKAFLDEETRIAERELNAEKADVQRVDRELAEIGSGRQKKNNQAVVIIIADKAAKAEIILSYVVYGPSWTPVYDIRVDSEKQKLSLAYNAYIAQNTGEDWTNVRISLSTARPEIGGSQPELQPWNIRLYEPVAAKPNARMKLAREEAAPAPAMVAESLANMYDADIDLAGRGFAMDIRGAEAKQGAVAVVFAVKGVTTIQSDAAKHRVSIMQASFPASFRYSTAPKLSPFAYLKAKVKNETDFPFLPGVSKVFLDGAFVADAALELVASGEEFWTFLGVDEGVKVEYKLLKRVKDEKGAFEKKTRYIYQYETTLTNAKKADVEIVAWDQLPISANKELVVKLIDPKYQKDSEALKKNNTEMFEWFFVIKPGESKKIPFSFSVEYPIDSTVDGL